MGGRREGARTRRDGTSSPQGRHPREGVRRGEQALLATIPDLGDDGPLRFASFAEVKEAYEISEPESLEAIDPYHIWTPEYAESRFRWRPKKPLAVLGFRGFLFPPPGELAYHGT